MYKVPIYVLKGLVSSLEKSNEVLKGMVGSDRTADVYSAIAENEKQIRLIKINFGLNE